FSLTSQAVGSGQALSEITRNARNAQSVIYGDLSAADVHRSGFIIIRGTSLPAFRNRADEDADLDYRNTMAPDAAERAIRSLDLNKDGQETLPAELLPRTALSSRTHRLDSLALFVRANARRQTGNSNQYTSDVSSGEQYVLYTHLRQPVDYKNLNGNAAGEGRDPGPVHWDRQNFSYTTLTPSISTRTTNPNNFYATQWILGRKAMILREPNTSNQILDATTGQPMVYFGRGLNTNSTSRAPFSGDSGSTGSNTSGAINANETVQNSFYDLAGMGIDTFRTRYMPGVLASATIAETWPDPLLYRPTGFPAPSRPLTPLGAARTTPCFLPACTQFAVEFAGDYLNQDPATGAILGYAGQQNVPAEQQTDGKVDFCVDPVTKARTVRWYGFPRDTDGDGHIFTGTPIAGRTDTLPARDVVRSFDPSFNGFAFEKDLAQKFGAATLPDYAAESNAFSLYGNTQTRYPRSYVTAWSAQSTSAGAQPPRMIRIVFALDDPAGRIANEQTFEFVAELP
ncbi:MAG TPA: hypothetical protein VF796_21470, partial [Humisphaera sp.]